MVRVAGRGAGDARALQVGVVRLHAEAAPGARQEVEELRVTDLEALHRTVAGVHRAADRQGLAGDVLQPDLVGDVVLQLLVEQRGVELPGGSEVPLQRGVELVRDHRAQCRVAAGRGLPASQRRLTAGRCRPRSAHFQIGIELVDGRPGDGAPGGKAPLQVVGELVAEIQAGQCVLVAGVAFHRFGQAAEHHVEHALRPVAQVAGGAGERGEGDRAVRAHAGTHQAQADVTVEPVVR